MGSEQPPFSRGLPSSQRASAPEERNLKGLVVEFSVPQRRKRRDDQPPFKDPVPRIARLLALAHKWEGVVRSGEVESYAEIARRMGLSRARVTQIYMLSLLAPEIQDAVLLSYGNRV